MKKIMKKSLSLVMALAVMLTGISASRQPETKQLQHHQAFMATRQYTANKFTVYYMESQCADF